MAQTVELTENTYRELMESLIKGIYIRTRIDKIENMISTPTPDEVAVAILDALDEINMMYKVTHFTMLDVFNNSQLKRLVELCASKNVVEMLIFDWTAHGQDLTIDVFNVANRLSDYHSLRSMLEDKCNLLLENFKKQFIYIRGTSYRTIKKVFTYSTGYLYTCNNTYLSKLEAMTREGRFGFTFGINGTTITGPERM